MAFARVLLAAAFLMVGFSACNSDDLPPAGQYGSISGIVTDHVSGKPIVGAVITVDAILTVTTDANGKFSIDKVPAGDFDYTITAQGYASLSASAIIAAGKPTTINPVLDVAPAGTGS